MASQVFGVTGNRRLKRNQGAELNARLRHLPSIIASEQQAEQARKDEAFRNKQLNIQKKQDKRAANFQQRQAQAGFGLEAAKLGLNLGTSSMLAGGGPTIGSIANKFKGKSQIDPPMRTTGAPTGDSPSSSGYFGGLQLGSGLAGGLSGYGMGQMIGGKKKGKKALFGTGAGMLTGMLSGGGLGGALSGGLFGGIGGLL